MNETSMREGLLQQNGKAAVDAELGRLNQIVALEQRRVRRLRRWTIVAWLWVLLAFVLQVLMVNLSRAKPGSYDTTQPASAPAAPLAAKPESGRGNIVVNVIVLVLGAVMVAGFFVIPVGIVLLVMLILAHRTARTTEIRACLGSIDAQLRMLALGLKQPPPPNEQK